jgi:hypothetical protein
LDDSTIAALKRLRQPKLFAKAFPWKSGAFSAAFSCLGSYRGPKGPLFHVVQRQIVVAKF